MTPMGYVSADAVAEILSRERARKLPLPEGIGLSLAGKTLEDINLQVIQRVLADHHGNQTATAKQLGISRTTLWRFLGRAPQPESKGRSNA